MKRRFPTLNEYGNSYNFSQHEYDSYEFNGSNEEWQKLIDILKDPKYKNNLIDISYSEKLFSLENDTDVEFIPKKYLDKVKKYD